MSASLRYAASALTCVSATAALGLAVLLPSEAQAQYNQRIGNDLSKCRGNGPAIRITATDVKSGAGTIRVQLYRATKQDWLSKGRWLKRIEVPARAGTMTFCMPVPQPGSYGIAIRHDINNNDQTDLTLDGGGMSNNPSINILNLGKPSYDKAALTVGEEVESITVRMRYM